MESLINKGYIYTRKCRGDGNCYYRAVYYAYMETLILKGPWTLSIFIHMLQHHKTNELSQIHADDMFTTLTTISAQLHSKLVLEGKRKALQHLFQSVLLVPEFDFVRLRDS